MDRMPHFAEFDPDLHPVGYALAIELLADSEASQAVDRQEPPVDDTGDRFGWELNIPAA